MTPLLNAAFIDSRYRHLRFRAAIVLYALVLVLGSIPGARVEVGMFAPGLVLHFVTYAVLTLLLFTAGLGSSLARAAKSLVAIMAMGAFDEFVQSFFSYRTAAIGDWLVDCAAGLLVAGMLALLCQRGRMGNCPNEDVPAK